MTVWLTPVAFLLLIPLIAFVLWFAFNGGPKKGYLRFGVVYFANVRKSLRTQLKYTPEVLKVIGIVFAVIAMARPQTADEKVKRNVEGIDIMITFDVSESMLIEDMKPVNRLEAAKKTVQAFIKKRVSDRIGVVVFSGEAYTRVPLTLDYELLLNNVAEITTSRNIKMGTAIGVALAAACGRLKDSTATSKVLVLLTDGESNTGLIDPLTALRIAKGYGIKVYTIGAGIDGDAQLPVMSTNIFGRPQKHYQPIHSSVNVPLLTQMAEETGGKFFRATDADTLDKVFSEIDRLEKTKIDVDRYVKYNELFQQPLLWAVLFYFLGALLQLTVFRRGI
ncbi:MAG: VWA domain-containing protein [Bdellovibrionaceae bacterium]|nr:VWA domain-containing protein [Pseudobdellovibrionaceae bacterium]